MLGKVWAIGFSFGASVAAGGLIGWVIDHYAKSSPIGILIGLGLGLTTGTIRFVREARGAEREMAAPEAKGTPKPGSSGPKHPS